MMNLLYLASKVLILHDYQYGGRFWVCRTVSTRLPLHYPP
jgi:hypothetical protein